MSYAFFRREWPRLGLLALVAALVWLGATNRWTPSAWATPASYSVDALETLARFQVSAENGLGFNWSPTVQRLGAPWGADWSAYPLPDAPWYWLAGRLVNLLGLIPASNAMLLLAHVLAVLSFYLCARALNHRVAFAAGAALLFGFSYSIFHRGLSHHSFALACTVPPGLLVVWWTGSGRRLWQMCRTWIATGVISAIIGTASPYFIFLYLQLLVLALLYRWHTQKSLASLQAGGFAIAVCLLVFVTVNFPALLSTVGAAQDTVIRRNYAGTEIYGLKPIELVIPPPTHRWPAAAALGRNYGGATQLQGELFTSYLGLIGIFSAGLMLATFIGRLARQRAGFRPAHATLSLWIIALAMVGGINALLALAGLDQFRAGNRYSIHLLALALLFFSGWATRHLRLWSAFKAWSATVLIIGLGLWDQAPPLPSHAHQNSLRDLATADQLAGTQLAELLPAQAKIFQLPATVFPEAGPQRGMSDYEHLRLLLGTQTQRFSYGALAGSLPQLWTEHAASLPPPALIATLEQAGFAALLVDLRAYTHETDLIQAFNSLGYAATPLAGRPELALVRLNPVSNPTPPDLASMIISPRWAETAPAGTVSAHALIGWFDLEIHGNQRWRWAGREAVLGLWNGQDTVQMVNLTARVSGISPGRLTLTLNGVEVRRIELQRTPIDLTELSFSLPPGSSQLKWHFDGRLVRPGGDPRTLGFQVEALQIHPTH
jgi:hypothetical protein